MQPKKTRYSNIIQSSLHFLRKQIYGRFEIKTAHTCPHVAQENNISKHTIYISNLTRHYA